MAKKRTVKRTSWKSVAGERLTALQRKDEVLKSMREDQESENAEHDARVASLEEQKADLHTRMGNLAKMLSEEQKKSLKLEEELTSVRKMHQIEAVRANDACDRIANLLELVTVLMALQFEAKTPMQAYTEIQEYLDILGYLGDEGVQEEVVLAKQRASALLDRILCEPSADKTLSVFHRLSVIHLKKVQVENDYSGLNYDQE